MKNVVGYVVMPSNNRRNISVVSGLGSFLDQNFSSDKLQMSASGCKYVKPLLGPTDKQKSFTGSIKAAIMKLQIDAVNVSSPSRQLVLNR
jgi:hypothetical protein